MQRPRHPYLPALAILLMAGVLAACGVKGELERPAASLAPGESAAADDGAARTANPAAATKSIFYEKSSVQSVGRDDMVLPKMPPREWEKKKNDAQNVQKARTVSPNSQDRKSEPDRPFILDGLL